MLSLNPSKKAGVSSTAIPAAPKTAAAPKVESKETKVQAIRLFKSEQLLKGYSVLYKEKTLDLSLHGTFHPEDITLDHTTTVSSESMSALVTLEDMKGTACLASVSTDGKVHWCRDTSNIHLTATLTGHTDRVNVLTSANISMKDLGDVSVILTGSNDKTIRIWNMSDGSCLKTLGGFFSGHSGAITALVVFEAALTYNEETGKNDREFLASGSSDTSIRLWNLKNGTCIAKLTGHTGIVSALTWLGRTPYSGYLVSGSSDNTLRIWDISYGYGGGKSIIKKCIDIVSVSDSITALVALPDEQFASAEGRNIQLYSSRTWQSYNNLLGHTDTVTSLVMLPDKEYLASGSKDSHIRVWDIHRATCLKILTGHAGPVTALTFHSKRGFLISASSDKSLRFWHTPLRPLTYTDIIPLLNMLKANSKFIETYRDDWNNKERKSAHELKIEHLNLQNVELGDRAMADLQAMLEGYSKLTRLNLQNTGLSLGALRVLYAMACTPISPASSLGGPRVRNLQLEHEMMEQLQAELAEKQRAEQQLQAELAEKQRAEQQRLRARMAHESSHTNKTWWDIDEKDNQPRGCWSASVTDASPSILPTLAECLKIAAPIVSMVATTMPPLHTAAKSFVLEEQLTALRANCIKMLDLSDHYIESMKVSKGFTTWSQSEPWSYDGLAAFPDGRVACGFPDCTIHVLDPSTKTCNGVLVGHTNSIFALALVPEGVLASGSADNTVRLWNLRTESCIAILTGHTGYVYALALLSNGMLASGSADNTIGLWNLSSHTCIRKLTEHKGAVTALAMLPDGRHLASGSTDNTIRLWDIHTNNCVANFFAHMKGVLALAVLERKHLISGGGDHTIRIWNLDTRSCVQVLTGHTDFVCKLVLQPGGLLVSSSRDKTLRLWDLRRQICLGEFFEPNIKVARVAMPILTMPVLSHHSDLQGNACYISLVTLANGQLLSSHKTGIYFWTPSRLNLSFINIHPLLEALKTNTSVTALNLQNIRLADSEVTMIQALLHANPRLTLLNLQSSISPAMLKTLYYETRKRVPPLTLQHETLVTVETEFKAIEAERIRKENLQTLFNRAQVGEASAQYDLAMRCLTGREVIQDEKVAIEWCRKAAAQRHQDAQYFLGECYDKGKGVIQDEKTAIKWYKKAADQGHAAARQRLLELGEDLLPPTQAVPPSAYAAAPPVIPQSFIPAASQEHLFTSVISVPETKATIASTTYPEIESLLSTAAQGDVLAYFKLGYCYANGLYGVTVDQQQAFIWFMKAAQQGFANAERNVARCYEHGFGVELNLQTAVSWYQRAIEHGSAKAKIELAALQPKIAEHEREINVAANPAESKMPIAQPVYLNIPAKELVEDKDSKQLGSGKFGVVYSKYWRDKYVAVKKLHTNNDEEAKTLETECITLIRLDVAAGKSEEHARRAQYVIKFLGCSPSKPFRLVMELANGGNLFTYLHPGATGPGHKSEPLLSGEEQMRWAIEIASGLAFLHEERIEHRDLKSFNILLHNRQIKLADFGLSRIREYGDATSSISIVGTPVWKAPEVLLGVKINYSQADIYSFGVVLWELVTRTVPNLAPPIVTLATDFAAKHNGMRNPLPAAGQASPKLTTLIEQCCQMDPNRRPSINRILSYLRSSATTFTAVPADMPPASPPASSYQHSENITYSMARPGSASTFAAVSHRSQTAQSSPVDTAVASHSVSNIPSVYMHST